MILWIKQISNRQVVHLFSALMESKSKFSVLAPASQVSSLGYSGLILAALIGFFFWNEIPDFRTGVGTILIATAGTLVAREKVEKMPSAPSATHGFPST